MKITKIRAVYFSGTGNTGKAVVCVAKKMSEVMNVPYEAVSIHPSAVRRMEITFKDDEFAIIGTPTYDGRVPTFLLPYFQQQLKGANTPACAICTFGNRSVDDALIELRALMQDNGFMTIGAASIVAQHVFASQLAEHRPNVGEERLLKKLAKELAQQLDAMDKLPTEPVNVVGHMPLRPPYTPRDRYGYPINITKVRPKTNKNTCNKCGICIKMCPVDAIAPDGVQIPGPCVKCGTCLKVCPTKSKHYNDEKFSFHQNELVAQHMDLKKSEIFHI